MDVNSLGIFVLRVGFGSAMVMLHGLPLLLGFSKNMSAFPDPLGIGPTASLSLAISAELLCAGAVVLGLFTRIAALAVVLTMAAAFFIVHAKDPMAQKELTLLYLLGFSAIFACGPGKFSLDGVFGRAK